MPRKDPRRGLLSRLPVPRPGTYVPYPTLLTVLCTVRDIDRVRIGLRCRLRGQKMMPSRTYAPPENAAIDLEWYPCTVRRTQSAQENALTILVGRRPSVSTRRDRHRWQAPPDRVAQRLLATSCNLLRHTSDRGLCAGLSVDRGCRLSVALTRSGWRADRKVVFETVSGE